MRSSPASLESLTSIPVSSDETDGLELIEVPSAIPTPPLPPPPDDGSGAAGAPDDGDERSWRGDNG